MNFRCVARSVSPGNTPRTDSLLSSPQSGVVVDFRCVARSASAWTKPSPQKTEFHFPKSCFPQGFHSPTKHQFTSRNRFIHKDSTDEWNAVSLAVLLVLAVAVVLADVVALAAVVAVVLAVVDVDVVMVAVALAVVVAVILFTCTRTRSRGRRGSCSGSRSYDRSRSRDSRRSSNPWICRRSIHSNRRQQQHLR